MPLGPFSSTVEIPFRNQRGNSRQYRKVQYGVRNAKHKRRQPSPYELMIEEITDYTAFGRDLQYYPPDAPDTPLAYQGQVWIGDAGVLRAQTHALAYDKLVQKVRDTASLGQALAERKEAVAMIATRAGQILNHARRLRRGDLSSLVPKRSRKYSFKGSSKDLSALWLEYHFGWEPLIKDIHTGVEILESPFPYGRKVVGHSKLERSKVAYKAGEVIDSSNSRVSVSCRLQGLYTTENPLLATANQFGLVNPVSIAWEVVPFSFVVDWFTNVGSFLSQSTDFLGFKREQEFTTFVYKAVGSAQTSYDGKTGYPPFYRRTSEQCLHMVRTLGIQGPPLVVKPFKGFSLTRGATAIALLVGFLK